jgi:hypothetical protein
MLLQLKSTVCRAWGDMTYHMKQKGSQVPAHHHALKCGRNICDIPRGEAVAGEVDHTKTSCCKWESFQQIKVRRSCRDHLWKLLTG